MKKVINSFLSPGRIAKATLLGTLLVASSCQKFTELNPLASLSENTAFTSANSIELVANGVYQSAAIGTYSGGAGRGYPFGSASIEQGEMRGEDMVNLQAFYDFTYRALYSTATANNVNHWEQLYALINQANILINGVRQAGTNGVISAASATQYEGEGRFLRALAHHELLIHFSRPYADNNGANPGVPYRENPINSTTSVQEGLAQGRGTVAQTYAKILADLDFAETNLPATRSAVGVSISRATSGAAIALKTRVKQHMQDWAGVITEGTKLGTAGTTGTFTSPIGNYKLEATVDAPFVNYSANAESIFSIANSLNSNPGVNGALASMFGPTSLGSRDLIATSPNLYNAPFWVTGDTRRTLLQVVQTTGSYPFYFNYKYRQYTTRADWAPILRYAEVLLNVSEAYSRQGNTTQALALLNAVRNRAVPVAERFTTAPADLTQAILNERRIEFTGEGRRWPDIHRLALDPKYSTAGIPAKIDVSQIRSTSYNLTTRPVLTGIVAAIPYNDYRFLWPIPTSEASLNPTLLAQQNPGY
ncbi:RagB/SusD family nutrient uptake outer membrane protein [Fibrella forsythiae]|uniref:RagB/SusD family nutrient uptake outer membrane protein n=1 Tax=Fibrella forsythiae TaxID=2817061 RepID=A0ABS3JBT4_9BACT|nr:RagB/SusD family nutrient uptake outer membrane protein [Fibrella forsythiae]MBO0947451.1 RagB/SusD family nutrient uptake outer membrane protein [Fibrella forsythiae]